MHLLNRLLQILPAKRGSENGMPAYDALPGSLKGGNIQCLAKSTNHLLDVYPRPRSIQAVKQHTLL
jgi:hypothetical protein